MKNCRKFPFLSLILILSFHYTLPSAIGAAAARAGGAGQMTQAREPLAMFGVPARVAAAAGGVSAAQAAGAGQMAQAREPLPMLGMPARTAAAVAGLPRVGLAQERMEGRVAAAVITTDAKKNYEQPVLFQTGRGPCKVSFHPDGNLLAITNNVSHTVTMFAINKRTGILVPALGTPSIVAGSYPFNGIFSPNGKWFANINSRRNTLHMVHIFAVDAQKESLTPVAGSPFALPNSGYAVAFSPDSTLLAVTNIGDNPRTTSLFAVNKATGVLTHVPNSPFAGLGICNALSFSPDGKWLVGGNINCGAELLSVVAIDREQSKLVPVSGSPFKTGGSPYAVAHHPNGRLVVSSHSNCVKQGAEITVSTVDQKTGALMPVQELNNINNRFVSSSSEASLSFPPDGKWLANLNNYDRTITVYAIDEEGTFNHNPVERLPFVSTDFLRSVAYSPDGLFFAAVDSRNNTVRVYRVNQVVGALAGVTKYSLMPHQESAHAYNFLNSMRSDLASSLVSSSRIASVLADYIAGPIPTPIKQPAIDTDGIIQNEIDKTRVDGALRNLHAQDLFVAIAKNNVQEISSFLTPFTINLARAEQDRTPLLEAAYLGHSKIVKALLNYKGVIRYGVHTQEDVTVDLDAVDDAGNTALILAILKENFDSAILIAQKMNSAQRQKCNNKGAAALALLLQFEKPDVADPNIKMQYATLKKLLQE